MLSPRPESIKFFQIKGDAETDREGKLPLFLCFLMFLNKYKKYVKKREKKQNKKTLWDRILGRTNKSIISNVPFISYL